jgi:hypothetical protein
MVDDCKVSCVMVIYIITLEAMINAFIRARKRGVFMFLHVDKGETDNRLNKSLLDMAHKTGFIIQVSTRSKVMHRKFGTYGILYGDMAVIHTDNVLF